jgi:hypothetical protein
MNDFDYLIQLKAARWLLCPARFISGLRKRCLRFGLQALVAFITSRFRRNRERRFAPCECYANPLLCFWLLFL